MSNNLRMLLIKNDGGNTDALSENLSEIYGCNVDSEYSSVGAIQNRDLLKYNVAVIDASDDGPTANYRCFSEYLKHVNPEIIIIGISLHGYLFKKENLEGRSYDEKIVKPFGKSTSQGIIEALIKYGFEFPAEGVAK